MAHYRGEVVLVFGLLSEKVDLFLQTGESHGIVDHQQEFLDGERLFDEVVGAKLCGLDRGFDIA